MVGILSWMNDTIRIEYKIDTPIDVNHMKQLLNSMQFDVLHTELVRTKHRHSHLQVVYQEHVQQHVHHFRDHLERFRKHLRSIRIYKYNLQDIKRLQQQQQQFSYSSNWAKRE